MAETRGCSRKRCRSTTESTPPDNATATRFPAKAASSGSALGSFLELAIAHQPLEALLDELFGLFLLQLLQRLGERLSQRLRGRLRIAMRAAERLGHDLVDEAHRLQPACGDAER